MNRFYIENEQIRNDKICIVGSDVNHIKNVLRLKTGDDVCVCDGKGKEYICKISDINSECVKLDIIEKTTSNTELNNKIYLFQGLPKKDKMELIIQKAVELGVTEVIPVITKRTVVKIEDGKKEAKKLARWQAIATSAAEQSKRGIIPNVHNIVNFKEALKMAADLDCSIIPYENAKNMKKTVDILKESVKKGSIGIFIGPEGGFDDNEIDDAIDNNTKPITLGKRILRTETAGFTIMSILMFLSENENIIE